VAARGGGPVEGERALRLRRGEGAVGEGIFYVTFNLFTSSTTLESASHCGFYPFHRAGDAVPQRSD
jgi:hypothetical protein